MSFKKLTLYSHPASPPSRACLMLMRILEINVDVKFVDLAKKAHLDEEFLKLNPNHQVPVLVDGDFVLSESRAILAYLVNSRKPGSTLYPTNSKARALVDARLYYDACVVFEQNAMAIRGVFRENATSISIERRERVESTVKQLESFLIGEQWFAGKNVTIADISLVAIISQLEYCGFNFTIYPNITAWYERCKLLPGFKETTAGAEMMGKLFKSKLEDGGGFQ